MSCAATTPGAASATGSAIHQAIFLRKPSVRLLVSANSARLLHLELARTIRLAAAALPSAARRPKGALNQSCFPEVFVPMKIRFADTRPEGDYALVLPVAGKDWKALG